MNGYDITDGTFAVNVRGSILLTKELIMRRGDYGRVINISTDALQVFAGQITCGAGKADPEAPARSTANKGDHRYMSGCLIILR